MTYKRIFLVFSLLALLLLVSACGPSNTVRLLPMKPAASVLPTPSASTIAVVKFTDKRVDTSSLGLRRDKSYFTTMDDTADWVSKAIADRLSASGFQVSYTMNASSAKRAAPDYILNGSIDQLEVRETSATSFEAKIRVNYVSANKDKVILRQPLMAAGSTTTFPNNSAVEKLLAETLKDIVEPMNEKISTIVQH